MKKLLPILFIFVFSACGKDKMRVSDQDIVNAYDYLLGRVLVLKQEILDFHNNGYAWNKFYHRKISDVTWANPDLDVAYSEAWAAIDDKSCALVEVPKIKNRYYTVQALNSWGETVANINERTFPNHPYGKFALCTKDSQVKLPKDTEKISLQGNKFRVLARIELGDNPREAVRLQKQITLKSTGKPNIAQPVNISLFTNQSLPGVEIFDKASSVIHSEPDINPGVDFVQQNALKIAGLIEDPSQRARVSQVIQTLAIPDFFKSLHKFGKVKNGWMRPSAAGNYDSDFKTRALVNYTGIDVNNSNETVFFRTNTDSEGKPLNGSNTYTMTFPKKELPKSMAHYFWSVAVVDSEESKVVTNPLKKYTINNQNKLQPDKDGSITLVFADKLPNGVYQENWLPTPAGKNFNVTFKFYGPAQAVINNNYFPPPLVQKAGGRLARSFGIKL